VPKEAVQPTGVERTFGAEEIIVSKTDLKGIITYANDIFLRVSGYREEDVVGQPHSLIRHPQMPRAVFRLLWNEIEAGREVFAYVLNLASDGAQYWVLAHVTPSFGPDNRIIGYHSNRRSPQIAAVERVKQTYELLRIEEERHTNVRSAADAGYSAMLALLAHQEQTYSQYVWSLIHDGRPE